MNKRLLIGLVVGFGLILAGIAALYRGDPAGVDKVAAGLDKVEAAVDAPVEAATPLAAAPATAPEAAVTAPAEPPPPVGAEPN